MTEPMPRALIEEKIDRRLEQITHNLTALRNDWHRADYRNARVSADRLWTDVHKLCNELRECIYALSRDGE
jgi:hypothetical protein